MRGLALALVLAPRVAEACTCRETSPEDDFKASEVVAEVVILAVEAPAAEEDFLMEEADEQYFAQVEVRRIWKGRSRIVWEQGRAHLAFVGGHYSFGCGYGPVKPGEVHILFLWGAADAPWLNTSGCSSSTRGGGARGEERLQRVRSALGPGWLPTPTGWVEGPGCASCATTEPTSLDAFWFGLLLLLRPRRSPNALSFPSTTTYPSPGQFAGTRRLRSRASHKASVRSRKTRQPTGFTPFFGCGCVPRLERGFRGRSRP